MGSEIALGGGGKGLCRKVEKLSGGWVGGKCTYLNDLNNYGEVRVVQIHLVVKVTILDHHTSHQFDDLIPVHAIVVTSLVVDSKLQREREREREKRERDGS